MMSDDETKLGLSDWETISRDDEDKENGIHDDDGDDDWEFVVDDSKKEKPSSSSSESPSTKKKKNSSSNDNMNKKKNITTDDDGASYKDDLIHKATKNGDVVAMWNIGNNYYYGKFGFPKDYKESQIWFEKSHKAGYIPATFDMAYNLLLGKGVDTGKNPTLAMKYMTMAAEGGHDLAAYHLGKAFGLGRNGLVVNKQKGIQWLKVALSGDCEFQYMKQASKQKAQKLLDELLLSSE